MCFPRVRTLGEEGRGSEPCRSVREHAQDRTEEPLRQQPQPIATPTAMSGDILAVAAILVSW